MIQLTIENKDYNCPTDYKDISLGDFKNIQTWLELDHIKPKVEKIIESGVKGVENEEETLNFYIDFINRVTDIPKKHLMQVKPYGTDSIDELSLQWVFETLSFLLCMPQIEQPQPIERINNLYFIDKLDGNQGLMKDANMIEYTEANAVTNAYNRLEANEGKYDYLNLLLAIMYRPKVKSKWWSKAKIEEYNSDVVKERAKDFDSVDMGTVWNCLFFFTQLKLTSLRNTQQYLKGEMAKAQEG